MNGSEHNAINDVLAEIKEELIRARDKYNGFNSNHEGYAAIKEELDELWTEIKSEDPSLESLHREAIQIAAMAVMFVQDCTITTEGQPIEIKAEGTTHKVFSFTERKEDGEYISLKIKGAWARLLKDQCILDIIKRTVIISRVYAKSVGLAE